MKELLIALDYDQTYTEDPAFWLEFVKMAQRRGHNVICVTMRYQAEVDHMDDRLKDLVKVYPTSRKQKLPYMKEIGINPDIWIDDNPYYLV